MPMALYFRQKAMLNILMGHGKTSNRLEASAFQNKFRKNTSSRDPPLKK